MAKTLLVLRALTGELRGQEFKVHGKAHWVLGRSRSCSLRLHSDSTVSRQHCIIEIDAQGVWVQDLGSLNGTHVNGTRISAADAQAASDATMVVGARQNLNDGDELRICNNVFAVCLTEVPTCQVRARGVQSSHTIHLSQSV